MFSIFQSNDDLLKVDYNPESRDKHIQPFLICAVSGKEKTGPFFIRADGKSISVGSNALIAFDILVKMHYCFDLKFAADLDLFYNFITTIVMQMDGEVKSSCSSLDSCLQNISSMELHKMTMCG